MLVLTARWCGIKIPDVSTNTHHDVDLTSWVCRFKTHGIKSTLCWWELYRHNVKLAIFVECNKIKIRNSEIFYARLLNYFTHRQYGKKIVSSYWILCWNLFSGRFTLSSPAFIPFKAYRIRIRLTTCNKTQGCRRAGELPLTSFMSCGGGWCHIESVPRTETGGSCSRITIELKNEYDYGPVKRKVAIVARGVENDLCRYYLESADVHFRRSHVP